MKITINSVIVNYETGDKYLVLWLSPNGEYGYWYNLSSSSRIPVRFQCGEIIGADFEVSDFEATRIIRPEETLSDKERTMRDSNWAKIKDAVESEPDVYETSSRFALLAGIDDKRNLKMPNLYYLLDKYWRAGKSVVLNPHTKNYCKTSMPKQQKMVS